MDHHREECPARFPRRGVNVGDAACPRLMSGSTSSCARKCVPSNGRVTPVVVPLVSAAWLIAPLCLLRAIRARFV
jgi:hypothetical protein